MHLRILVRRASCLLLVLGPASWLLPACGSAFSSAEADGGTADGGSKADTGSSSDAVSPDGTSSSDGGVGGDAGSSSDTGSGESGPEGFKCGTHDCPVDSDFCLDLVGKPSQFSCNEFSSTCLSSTDDCHCAALSEGTTHVEMSCVAKSVAGKCTVECTSLVTVGDASKPPDAASGGK